jgi:hypothetical protein
VLGLEDTESLHQFRDFAASLYLLPADVSYLSQEQHHRRCLGTQREGQPARGDVLIPRPPRQIISCLAGEDGEIAASRIYSGEDNVPTADHD